jgi:polyhydroxybutyrate depolymerase
MTEPARRVLWVGSLACTLAAAGAGAVWIDVDAGRGPVPVRVPDAPAPPAGRPLIVVLHGFGVSGAIQEAYFQLSGLAAGRGFLYAIPNGTTNPNGERFWNATDACCDTFGSGVDDVGYLEALVDAIDAEAGVDTRRVVYLGHSNGGFMAYRMACSTADRTAAIASLAGATYLDPAACTPSRPVRTLEIHGTSDDRIDYEGGELMAPYPGAAASAAIWAAYDGCVGVPVADDPFDAEADLPGAETEVLRYGVGCRGGGAELWTIVGGEHIPSFTATFRQRLIDWIDAATTDLFTDAFESGDTRAWAVVAR